MPKTVETRIEETLESIHPTRKADGGGAQVLRFNEEGGGVVEFASGACEDCPISMMTLKEGIEQCLKSGIPSITEVQVVLIPWRIDTSYTLIRALALPDRRHRTGAPLYSGSTSPMAIRSDPVTRIGAFIVMRTCPGSRNE
jgi:Fe-S cluster biogenesis protein NfuA